MQNGTENDILCSTENGIQKIILNRPRKKNAINLKMYSELQSLLKAAADNNDVHLVVITGTGAFFSSGNEISFSSGEQESNFDSAPLIFKKFVDSLITFPKLLIAVVNGPAIGIAVTMLPLFDIVFASKEAYFETPFTKLGLVAEGCSTYTFPRIFGKSKAGDMLYLGYKMSAQEAKQFGFVSKVYNPDELDQIWAYVTKMRDLSSESIGIIKRLVNKWDQEILLQVNKEEAEELAKRMESPDLLERFMKFLSRKNKL